MITIQEMNEFQAWQKILEEWKRVDIMKKLNQRLYDELGGAIIYILEYTKRNNIDLPTKERLFRMMENIHTTTDSIKEYHRKINSDESLQEENNDKNRQRLDNTIGAKT